VLTVARASGVSTFTPKQTTISGTWQVNQTVVLSGFIDGTGSQANDGSFNGTCVISAVNGNNFSCVQSAVDIASHSPKDASVVTFAPVSSGSFTFWVGARDGAFQQARKSVTVTIAGQGAQRVDLNWNASLTSGPNGCCSYNIYRSTTSETYGPTLAVGVSGTTFTDVPVSTGETYYYVATAFDGITESPFSNEAMAVVP
jgi:fibronectin type 3 domain-containing protein